MQSVHPLSLPLFLPGHISGGGWMDGFCYQQQQTTGSGSILNSYLVHVSCSMLLIKHELQMWQKQQGILSLVTPSWSWPFAVRKVVLNLSML